MPLVHVQWRLLRLLLAELFWGPQLEQAFSNLGIVGVQVGCRNELLGFEGRLDLLGEPAGNVPGYQTLHVGRGVVEQPI